MMFRSWVLAGMLVAMPAQADDVAFGGRTLEVDSGRESRPILGMRGVKYSIPGSAMQIVGKAELCVASQANAISLVSVDAAGGRLLADSRAEYRQKGRRSIRARVTVEAEEGQFRVVFTGLATAQADVAGHAPLMQGGAGWERALEAVIGIEQPLIDCIFR